MMCLMELMKELLIPTIIMLNIKHRVPSNLRRTAYFQYLHHQVNPPLMVNGSCGVICLEVRYQDKSML